MYPRSIVRSPRLGGTALALALTACLPLDGEAPEETETDTQEILNGTAVDPKVFPEIAIVDITHSNGSTSACTGFAIARNTVVTARHCLEPFQSARVLFPFNGVRTTATTRLIPDPNLHDVAALILTTQVDLPVYATIPNSEIGPATRLRVFGRVRNGAVSNTGTFHSGVFTAIRETQFNFSLKAGRNAEHGDSGGPVFIDNTHTAVGVPSGITSTNDMYARTELVREFLAAAVHDNSSCRASDGKPATCTGACAFYTCRNQCWPRGTPTAFVCDNPRLPDGSHVPRHDGERSRCRGGSWDMVLGQFQETQCFTNTTGARCLSGVDLRRGAIPAGETHQFAFACGTDRKNYVCRANASGGGWVNVGGSCGDATCSCRGGVDRAGRPVDPAMTTCGTMVCGTDAQFHRCGTGGAWTATGISCR